MNDSIVLYKCRLAKFDEIIKTIFKNEICRTGFIPFSPNPNWNFPIVKFPNGIPEKNETCTVVFKAEKRRDGKGQRNIVLIYKHRYDITPRRTQYRIFSIRIKNAISVNIEPENRRFWIYGMAENKQNPDLKDFVIIGIAYNDNKVPIKVNYQNLQRTFYA